MQHVEGRDPFVAVIGPVGRRERLPESLAVAVALHLGVVIAGASGLLEKPRPAARGGAVEIEIEAVEPVEAVKMAPPPEAPPAERAPAPRTAAGPRAEAPARSVAPTPARAAPVLAAEPTPDAPIDLPTIVSGDGKATHGQQSRAGEGDAPVTEPVARLDGVPGGRGPSPPAPTAPRAPPDEDRSRPVQLAGSSTWSCPFPPEADADQIDQAVVTVHVTVRPDGSALSASVVGDPGHGFGRAARACALGRRYQPALDRSGSPMAASAPVNVRFSR